MRTKNAPASLCLFCAFKFQQWPSLVSRRNLSIRDSKPIRRIRIGEAEPGISVRPLLNATYRFPESRTPRTKQGSKLRLTRQLARQGRWEVQDGDLMQFVFERLEALSEKSRKSGFMVHTGLIPETAQERFAEYESNFKESLNDTRRRTVLDGLRQAFIKNGIDGIDGQLKVGLQSHLANYKFAKSDIVNQARLADLRYPYEWYPDARTIQRKIHLHVGPTNSGKTYHALKRLESAASGIYAGPLRLLAHEVYSRLNALGKPCNLITGDERVIIESEETAMSSCTVEMVPVNMDVEVAVVDEIQMIGNEHRGWAWTQAVLGIKAQELHLCGEERAVPLIKELAAAMGDELEIHRYERLSPLRTMSTSLDGDLRKLRKGDCVVAFSRVQLHALRKDIERITGKNVAVVYGSLPPEIRQQQAKLFNDPDNDYDFLVASDAIGMGLNLSIRRIVFESTSRHNGDTFKTLDISDIKQIAGRAGRYRPGAYVQGSQQVINAVPETTRHSSLRAITSTPATNLGLVTTLEKMDLPIVQRAMQSEAAPIETAGIFPPEHIIVRFSTYFPPKTPFSYILLRLFEISRMHPRFRLCSLRHHIETADIIQQVNELTVADRITMCAAPVDLKDPKFSVIVLAFARCVGNQSRGELLDIPELNIDILDQPVTAQRGYLQGLESLHKSLVLYLWLSYRFVGIFASQDMAFHVKKLVEDKIDKVLTEVSKTQDIRQHLKKLRERALLQSLRAQVVAEGTENQTRSLGTEEEVEAQNELPRILLNDRPPELFQATGTV